MPALVRNPNSSQTLRHFRKVPIADMIMRPPPEGALTPFDSEYINRLLEAFEMAGTNVRDMQAILDATLDGT